MVLQVGLSGAASSVVLDSLFLLLPFLPVTKHCNYFRSTGTSVLVPIRRRQSPKCCVQFSRPESETPSYSDDIFACCWLPSATSRCVSSDVFFSSFFFLCVLLCEGRYPDPRVRTTYSGSQKQTKGPRVNLLVLASIHLAAELCTLVMPRARTAPHWLSQQKKVTYPPARIHRAAKMHSAD